ncbi:tyrosine-protein phosphatase [Rhodococcus globerulus]|uniref:tyrosine-protein phosphatase n=1 Tax=Rhodococcus globerulus TaxID=33008 RepID=UPI003017729D
MSRHGFRITGVLLVTGGVLLGSVGGAGLAQADPVIPPVLAELFSSGSAALGSIDPVAPDAPRLASIDNFRDVAGIGVGYAGADGKNVNKGVFYRSNVIVPNEADLATLTGLGLSTAYDLRSDEEVAKKPDVLPAGVTYMHLPIGAGDYTTVLSHIKSVDDSRAFMQEMNRLFVTGENERTQFGAMLTDMATTTGPAVFHCSGGKDRTGWTSYLLLSIAGVDAQTIMNDYLLTNEYTKDSIAANLATLQSYFGDAAANMAPLVSVEPNFLQAGIDQLTADYGTVESYLTEGLGLNLDIIGELKDKLLR